MSVLLGLTASKRLSTGLLRPPLHKTSTWHKLRFVRVTLFYPIVRSVQLLRASAPTTEPPSTSAEQPLEVTFSSLGVDRRLLDGLAALRLTKPAPIQAAAVPQILLGGNCAIQSYTGSGKTIAYLLPTLSRAIQNLESASGDAKKAIQVLVIAPSQELCIQIVNVAKALLPQDARAGVQQCIGGANITRQIEALKMNKPMLVVGTPGRLATLGRMGKLGVHHCGILVVDEVDQLMAADFSEDIQWLTEHAGRSLPSRQTVMVSATLTRSMLAKAARWCPRPQYINIGQEPAVPEGKEAPAKEEGSKGAEGEVKGPSKPVYGWGVAGWEGPKSALIPKTEASAGGVEAGELVPTLPPNLRHYMVVTSGQRKVDTLRRCIYALDVKRALVFMNFQQRLQDTMFKLQARKMEVGILHGDLDKLQRAQVLSQFRRGDYRALIVSDVLARGLDVPDCDAVFHLELPSSAAHYAHRAGRTGRMGAPGTVVVLAEPGERWVVEKIGSKLNMPIMEASLSGGELKLGAPPATDPAPRRRSADKEVANRERRNAEELGDDGDSGRKRRAATAPEAQGAPAPASKRRAEGGVTDGGAENGAGSSSSSRSRSGPRPPTQQARGGSAQSRDVEVEEEMEEVSQPAEGSGKPPVNAKQRSDGAAEWYDDEEEEDYGRNQRSAAAPRAKAQQAKRGKGELDDDEEEEDYGRSQRSAAAPPRAKAQQTKRGKGEWDDDNEEEEDSGPRQRGAPLAMRGKERKPRQSKDEWFDGEEENDEETRPRSGGAAGSGSRQLADLAPQQRKKIEKILRDAKLDMKELTEDDDDGEQGGKAAATRGSGAKPAKAAGGKGKEAADASGLSPLEALQAELAEIKAERKSRKSKSAGSRL